MNFLAHAEVARRLPRTNDDVVLGAMLPDLTHLVPLRVARHRLPPDVGVGWDCHMTADRVFHADARFRSAIGGMARQLRQDGWPRWPAHAAAHVSWELLLDGRWALRSAPGRWFATVLRSDAFVGSLDDAERQEWERLVHWQATSPLWTSYVEAGPVAERTWRRLRDTGVGFDAARIGHLAALLHEQVPVVEQLAEPFVEAAVTATIGASPPAG